MTETPATDSAPSEAPGMANVTLDMGEWSDAWEGQTVTIRPHLSYASDTRITTARFELKQSRLGDQDAKIGIQLLDYAVAVVEECVVSWTLRGHDGEVLAADRSGLSSPHAPTLLIDETVAAIMEFYEARRPKLKKRSKRSE